MNVSNQNLEPQLKIIYFHEHGFKYKLKSYIVN